MYYLAMLIGVCITILAAMFLSGIGAFISWSVTTFLMVIIITPLDGLGKDNVLNFLGIVWLTMSFCFLVCGFFVWGLAGDLSWMLKP